MRTTTLFALAMLGCLLAAPAEAQVNRGVFRLSLDTDMLSIAGVEIEPEAGGEQSWLVVGLGPNQHGGVRMSSEGAGPTPFGLGFAWGLAHKLLFGFRLAFGLDVIAPDGDEDNTRIFDLALMPGLTWVPIGNRAKLFVSASPIFQLDRVKTDDNEAHTILGGFGLGIGALIFVARSLSVDLGFHFEGRFGNRENFNGTDDHVRDLRGVFRLGLSLWK